MKSNKISPKKNMAQAMVEFAIVLPILLLLLYGLLEAGRLLFIYSSIVTASRQAVRYGATMGTGTGGVPRYQDCTGIRQAAQKVDFLNAFDDNDIAISRINSAGTITAYCGGDPVTSTPTSDNTYTPANDNTDRLIVTIRGDFNPIVPKIVPFIARTTAKGNPITASSRRTILVKIEIASPSGGGGGGGTSTTTTVTTSPNPSNPGQPVTVTVTVSSSSGTPTGTVLISAGGSNCTVTLSGGTGTCANQYIFNSDTTVNATYTPTDANEFAASSGSVLHDVKDQIDTTTTVTASPEPSLPGQSVTITATVVNTYGSGAMPGGTVTISAAAGGCNINLSGGTGSCSITFNSVGASTITATYNPDANHTGSTGLTTHVVATTTPVPSNTPVPPTSTPVPTSTPLPPTPVTGCNSIQSATSSITIDKKTMLLTIPNTNPYPVTIKTVYVAWNYSAGHTPGTSSLYLQSADLNGTVFWAGSLNQPSANLPLSGTVVLPANTNSTITFTFDKTYTTKLGEQIQVFFSTPGCESYPIIRPSGSPTITPVPSANLKVQLVSGGTDGNTETQFYYRVHNIGSVATSNISTRIYFTLDGAWTAPEYVLDTYWDESGAATISAPTLLSGTTYYFTISYGSATLGAGGTWTFQGRLRANYWPTTYNGFNDFWHTTSALPASYTDWPTIPVFVSGSRVWGSTP